MRRLPHLKAILLVMAFVAASCGGDLIEGGSPSTGAPPEDPAPRISLDGTSWTVIGGTVDGAPFLPVGGRTATLSVDGARASGSTGCNTFQARISITDAGMVSLRDFAVTEIGCEPPVMEFEGQLLKALGEIDRFSWEADRLTLSSGDESTQVDLVAAAPTADVALTSVTWRLTGFTAGDAVSSVLAGTKPTLVFETGAARGNGGCNDFAAAASLDGKGLMISELVYTKIGCGEAVMQQEAEYFRMLGEASAWLVRGDTLTIINADGRSLTFMAEAPHPAEESAVAWVTALAEGDLEAAAALLAPVSLAYVNERGGLSSFASELAEGWGAWARSPDRRVYSLAGSFPNRDSVTAAVFVGTVEQEGMRERRAAAIVLVESHGTFLVDPFTEAGRIGFVVPRAEFIDRVAPEVAFELAMPVGFEVLLFLDTSSLPATVDSGGTDRLTVNAESEPPPHPGEHVLTAVHLDSIGRVGAQSVIFHTYP